MVPTGCIAKIRARFHVVAIFVQLKRLGATEDLLLVGYDPNRAEFAPGAYHF